MGRAPCCDKANVKKGPWSPEEDAKLKDYIDKYGTGGNWIALPQKAGLRRCGKSCRLRWLNYLRPNIRHGEFSEDEDRIICTLFATIGSRWSIIAAQLPGRTDNDIKNYWNTKLKKKILIETEKSAHKRPQLTFQTPIIPSHPFGYDHPPFTIPIPIPNDMTFVNNNNYCQVIKDDQYFLSFGGETSSCSSDGSTSNNRIISGSLDGPDDLDHQYQLCQEFQDDDQKAISTGSDDHHQQLLIHGTHDNSQMNYSSLEEIKQLISTDSCNYNNNNNIMSFFVDEIKAEEKIMYY